MAASIAPSGGASYHSNARGSPPQAMRSRMVGARSTRAISGSLWGRRRSRASHKRRTMPGPSRAARPARCSAASAVMRSVSRLSIARSGSYRATLWRPVSTTAVTPGTVSEVSAMFVARITRRRSDGWIAASCSVESREPCSSMTSTSGPTRARTSGSARLISGAPGRNESTCPEVAVSAAATAAASPSPG